MPRVGQRMPYNTGGAQHALDETLQKEDTLPWVGKSTK